MSNKDAVEKFRTLPQAGKVPAEVWDMFKWEREIADLEQQLAVARCEQQAAHETALKFLRRDWNDDELRAAGWID